MQQGRRSLWEKLRTKGKKKRKSLKRILRWRVLEEFMLLNWSLLVCTNIPSKSRSRPLLPAYHTSFPCALYLKRPLLPPHARHGKERQFDYLFAKTALRGPTIPSKSSRLIISNTRQPFKPYTGTKKMLLTVAVDLQTAAAAAAIGNQKSKKTRGRGVRKSLIWWPICDQFLGGKKKKRKT